MGYCVSVPNFGDYHDPETVSHGFHAALHDVLNRLQLIL